ncbi:MAG: cell wall-active antibiotics response protein [Clostridiaceae bacterium]|nr:cell wall-active antibiotics response protein [Clostridiaceae bacterium]
MNNKNISRIIWGIALVVVGTIFALNALGLTEISIFFDGWWTLFIIVPSFAGLFSKRGKFGSLIGLIIGVVLLLSAQGILDFASVWKLLIPIIIILIGLKMIFTSTFNKNNKWTSEKIKELKNNRAAPVKDTAAFSTHNLDYNGQIFEGVVLDAVFGSITCDLRNAIIEKDCVISASAVFASIDIKTPDHVQVKIDSNALFGGVSDKRKKRAYNKDDESDKTDRSDKTFTLYVEATCVFGGVNII